MYTKHMIIKCWFNALQCLEFVITLRFVYDFFFVRSYTITGMLYKILLNGLGWTDTPAFIGHVKTT